MTKKLVPSLISFLSWLDDNILLILAAFLIAFIPLYPKIPLWSPIEQYIVRVRAEDILIFLTGIVWVIQVLRKKVQWYSIIFWFVLAYAVVSFFSILSALFLTKTVPLQPLHVGKTLLHYFRYLEYFSLFFILFSAIRKRKDVVVLLSVFTVTVMAVALYGFGQKYLYWPVYSTMNREFSKGIRLYLGPHARVQSTFGGHYDMAAFLVIALPVLLALALRMKNKWAKLGAHAAYWVGATILIMSASRASFLSAMGAIMLVIFFAGLAQPRIWPKFRFMVTRGFAITFVMLILYATFGNDLTQRISHMIDSNPQVRQTFHDWNKRRKDVLANVFHFGPPSNGVAYRNPEDDLTNTPPSTELPRGVYQKIPIEQDVATRSASGAAIIEKRLVDRTWSECALKKELSWCIREEVLWPRAIAGFMRNPVLGSGYATLTKENITDFTEADSTDNNFLRTLGETGALGFITFYGAMVVIMYYASKNFTSQDEMRSALSIGLLAATIGLLVNAIYIDVFAASKVALTYWAMAGLFLSTLMMLNRTSLQSDVATGEVLPMAHSTQPAKAKKTSTKKKRKSKKK